MVLPQVRIGVQRKTWIDLVMSLDDGRLAGSIPKMDMAIKVLIIEGEIAFDKSNHMVVRSGRTRAHPTGWATLRHTRESLAGVAISVRYIHGLDVFYTDSLFDTAALLVHLGAYFSKHEHTGIVGRRTYVRTGKSTGGNVWGTEDQGARQLTKRINFLMGLGIGLKTAQNLLAANGGKIPLAWTLSKSELLSVPLIGEATADSLIKMLE